MGEPGRNGACETLQVRSIIFIRTFKLIFTILILHRTVYSVDLKEDL